MVVDFKVLATYVFLFFKIDAKITSKSEDTSLNLDFWGGQHRFIVYLYALRVMSKNHRFFDGPMGRAKIEKIVVMVMDLKVLATLEKL